ncbi:PhoX family protein [Paenibacillus sp. MBLB4367]|uniref:PhoX family protein n=1 Tax=Paenibacillus sp. MBLB4367 TaxID=3384767 RepID=UPI00390844B2
MSSKQLSRRKFLAYLGSSAATLAAASSGLSVLINDGTAHAAERFFDTATAPVTGKGILVKPSSNDELNLPSGFKYDVIAAYGDPINEKGDTFGYNNASAVFLPIEGSSVHGLLYVNHESSHPVWVHGARDNGVYSIDQTKAFLYHQGGSVLEVYRDTAGVWRMDKTSAYARRITGLEPFELTGPVKGTKSVHHATIVQGTFANRSGGKTLWGTVLACEGSYDETCSSTGLVHEHYGWVAEIDPADPKALLRKHTALGRLHHSGAAMGLSEDGRVVVYMGDVMRDACLYKYVSKGKFDPDQGKSNSALLTDGTLWAADLENGKWIELTAEAAKQLLEQPAHQLPRQIRYTKEQLRDLLAEQSDILTYATEAALILGATPLDSLGDLALHPADQSLFVAFTNNASHGNIHGHLLRVIEKNGDLGAAEFDFELAAAGGRQSGFSSPGAISFDRSGKLWMATNIASDKLSKGSFRSFQNNGIYVLPLEQEDESVSQFASAPVEAALAAPTFTPNEQTLFISVLHPGDASKDKSHPSSLWPHRSGDSIPRSALVAVTGI